MLRRTVADQVLDSQHASFFLSGGDRLGKFGQRFQFSCDVSDFPKLFLAIQALLIECEATAQDVSTQLQVRGLGSDTLVCFEGAQPLSGSSLQDTSKTLSSHGAAHPANRDSAKRAAQAAHEQSAQANKLRPKQLTLHQIQECVLTI